MGAYDYKMGQEGRISIKSLPTIKTNQRITPKIKKSRNNNIAYYLEILE